VEKLHHVQIKKVPLVFFRNNFYKYARIFMIFGTHLCKWLLIILINLLRCVPCTSLTWWRNADVTETMPFTVHVTITNHHAAERDAIFYPSRDVATKLSRFESGGLQHLGYPSSEGLPFADPWCRLNELKERLKFLPYECTKNYENPSIFVNVTAKKNQWHLFIWTRCRMVWLPNGEKKIKICLFVLTECTNVTDTHTA